MADNKIYDFAVVGTGIVGLATAYFLSRKFPSASILMLEKAHDVALHQSGHNSGVIHSGIYYKPGSFKAENCLAGYKLLIEFLEKHHLPYRLDGKLIVATDNKEIERLIRLYENGLQNGLRKIILLDREGIKNYEPHIAGLQGIYVPYTGVTDYRLVSKKLLEIIQAEGAKVLFNTNVEKIIPGNIPDLLTGKGTYRAAKVVVAAGLHSDRLYGENEFRIIPFRGEYYYLKKPWAEKIRSMIYPVPDPRYPFLGIHLTRHIDSMVSAGPSAVLSPGRETYRKFQINVHDLKDTFLYKGFRKMAFKNFHTGINEIFRSLFKPLFVKEVRKFLPGIPTHALYGYHSGIRAQLTDRQGNLIDDFVIRHKQNVTYVLNAPSPAATASLAIGEQVSNEV